MSRGLPSRRSVGLFAFMIVAVAACAWLGLWQLGVAQDEGRRAAVAAAADLPRQPLAEVTRPHAPFAADLSNRLVSAWGTYAAERTIIVVDRRSGGQAGSWVVTPLVTKHGTVAVLRGFVEGPPSLRPPLPPSGTVEVLGTLGPTESPRAGEPLPAPQRRSIDLAELVNEWPGDLYNVVLLASDERLVGASGASGAVDVDVAATGLVRVPPPQLDASLNLKNAAYAIQWWVFGLFAIWMWWKMMRAEPARPGQPVAPREEAHA
ncbi:MAG: SURF1 family protein [Micrococcales bacterium]|nr:SURF1 family protein [Micrococcales bacterium]